MTVRESNLVDVAPLREAFLRSGVSASEVCRRIQWYWKDGVHPDTTRLARALGLKPNSSHGRAQCAQRISVDRAALIARALHLAPHEVGL